MTASFTSGPWKITSADCNPSERGDSGIRFLNVHEAKRDGIWRGDIAFIHDARNIGGISLEERDANARLIAAAPDMLLAVTQYRNDLRHPPAADSIERRLEMIDALIAKATGK